MARILHVEDSTEWAGIIGRALADHRVDTASSYEEALALIQASADYDLALVDLNLESPDDRLGGEVLDLLKADYPATRRIVITGKPPAGPMRTNVLQRYGADEIIIKGATLPPDLRRVVADALARNTRTARRGDRRARAGTGPATHEGSGRAAASPALSRTVMVIYGRDVAANDALFDWLRAIGLAPLEWGQIVRETGEASPYIGQILERAFSVAQAVIAFLTPDEYVAATPVTAPGPPGAPVWRRQARPNVLIETGMALASDPGRTVLVMLGSQELPSDLAGRHFIRLNGTAQPLHELANRLQAAGCAVDRTGSQWLNPARFPDRDA